MLPSQLLWHVSMLKSIYLDHIHIEHMDIYVYVYTCICIYMYIYMSIYIYMNILSSSFYVRHFKKGIQSQD